MDRRRKAAPLPIFNKRPRQALLAHPNNSNDSSELYPVRQETYCGDYAVKGSHAQNYGQDNVYWQGQRSCWNQPQTVSTNKTWGSSRPTSLEQENVPPPYQLPPPPQKQQSVLHSTCGVPQGSGVMRAAHGAFTTAPKSVPPSTSLIMTEKNKYPPVKLHNASSHAEIEGHAKFTRQEMRILTATAQGIQHWSKFHHISCLLFEVFGSLNSAVTMEGSNAKQFVLKTPDGVMRCVFWEMDRHLPPLVRGHTLRVVGSWDVQKAFLKCYSVRPGHPNEEQLVVPAVEVSDRVMRQITASAAET
ncbi:hypothetical protein EMCRGX_G024085 [Ephydatia muelleri]